MFAPENIVPDEPDLLAAVRELYSCRPEYVRHKPWEIQWLLFALGYTDGLAPEVEIAAAVEVARTDSDPEEGAA